MKRFLKTVAALLLTTVMVVSLFPAMIFAEDEETTTTEPVVSIEETTAVDNNDLTDEVVVEDTATETTEEEVPATEETPAPAEEPVVEIPAEEPQVEQPVVNEPALVEEPVISENSIVAQPQDATVAPYKWATFSVETNGKVSSYLWQYSTNGGKTWKNLSSFAYNKDKASISVMGSYSWFSSNNGYKYRCIVTFKDKKKTKVTSDAATLYVASAQSFKSSKSKDLQNAEVAVDAPEGAFPAGTTMGVSDVDAAEYADAINEALGGKASDVTAVDISFKYDGAEVEPANGKQVTVTLKADAVKEGVKLVHIDDFGVATEVAEEDIVSIKNGEIVFKTDAFSVYAVIGSVVIEEEEGSFDFETDEYKITVSYTKEAKIPAGTELVVSQIEYDSDEYWDLWNKSFEKINENAVKAEDSEDEMGTYRGIASAVFFDISLINNGKQFEPEVSLQVEIALKNGGLPLFDGQDVEIIHFGEAKTKNADGTELIKKVQYEEAGPLADGMPEGVAVDSFKYDQTGFSDVGVITTDEYIDFEKAEYVPNLGDIDSLADTMLRSAPILRATGDPTINAGKTVTDGNGDGIYELALSVNATSQQSSETKAQKSNVVMVIDVSGSMGNSDSWIYYDTYTYDANTYDDYRYYTSSTSTSTQLYYGSYYTWGGNNWVQNTGWYSGGQTYYGNVYNATPYSGVVYAYETRLHATQRAACAVVDALLAKNVNDDNITDMFEITVIKFANRTANTQQGYNGTQTIIQDSTNATDIKNAINGLTAGGGTNWQAALEQALTEANYFKNTDTSQIHDPEEITSVIFLTDGFPTFYGNDQGYSNQSAGGESNNNIATCYTNSRTSARNIVSAGYTLYNIFAFGSDTTTYNNHTGFAYLRALTNYAYGSGNTDNYNETDITRQHAFNAKSTDDLVAAFETIINHITNQVGYAGVNLTDGVSLGATSTSVAVNGTAKPESMRYTVKDASGKLSYTVSFSNGTATFTIYNADGTTTTLTDSAAETVTTTINGTTINSQVYSVTVGTGESAKTYKMSPATIDANTGMVKWDLAGLGILESGYTYTVAFDVWPNQLAYDIAADLNNGIYADVDAALDVYGVTDTTERQHIKDAIVHNTDGSYSLYTNYAQGVEYYPATEVTDEQGNTSWTYGEKQTQEIPQPDPVPLEGSKLPLAKVWESDLALSELNELLWVGGEVGGVSRKYKITLYVWKAENETDLMNKVNTGVTTSNQPYITEVLGWDETSSSYIFEKDVAVAPGTMVNLDEAEALGFDITDTSKIRIFTNDQGTTLKYYVIESGHYYHVTEDGSDLHFELQTVLYHPMIVDGTLYNVFFGEGQTVVKMDPMYAVVATNYLKGGLNISKVVSSTQITVENDAIGNVTEPVDSDGIKTCEDEFTYEIKIWKVDDAGNKSAVYTYDDQIDAAANKTKSGSIGYRIFSKPSKGENGSISYGSTARGAILTEDSQYASLANDIYATIANNETTIILTMPANGEIRLVNLPSGTQYSVREIVDPAGNYTYAATKSQTKISETEITEGTVSTGNTVTGRISGNTASVETYYNWAASFYVYHSSDNTVEKISFSDERVKGTFVEETTSGGTTVPAHYDYTFSIADETKTGYLYGGYYKAYSGAKATAAEITGTAETGRLTYTDGWAKDNKEGTIPYDAGTASVWKKAQAYTATVETTGGGKGTEMTPVTNNVYYLKEVPNGYLRPYIHYTYDDIAEGKPLKKLYVITAADDTNYSGVGYIIVPPDMTTATTRSLTVTIKKPNGTIDATLTAKSVFDDDQMKKYGTEITKLSRGYLYWSDFSSYIGKGFDFLPCWNTLDGVLVTGFTVRTVNNGTSADLTSAAAIGVTDKDANSTPPEQD